MFLLLLFPSSSYKKGHNASTLVQKRPVRIRGNDREHSNMCLSFNDTNKSLMPFQCEFPYPPMQLFFMFDDEWYGYIKDEVIPLNVSQIESFLKNDEWKAENVELYNAASHVEKPW